MDSKLKLQNEKELQQFKKIQENDTFLAFDGLMGWTMTNVGFLASSSSSLSVGRRALPSLLLGFNSWSQGKDAAVMS